MKKNDMNEKKVNIFISLIVYIIGLVYFFPILYMFLTSLKSELKVIPPTLLFTPTLENFKTVLTGGIGSFLGNSVIVTFCVTIISLVLGVPAAYALVFGTIKKANGIFFWFVSSNLLPPVCVLIPIYLIFKYTGMLDTKLGLIIVYSGANIPLVIWMVRSFFKEVPAALIEAAEIDGCEKLNAFFRIIIPLTKIGIISAGLLVVIFVWNEFFFAVNLTYTKASTMPVYMASFMQQEGLFWAKLSAISTLAVILPIVLGWITQKHMIKGLTMGAVKG